MEKQLAFRISAELHKKLEELAKEQQRSVSQVARMAIESALNNPEFRSGGHPRLVGFR